MVIREDTFCQKRKSSAEKDGGVVHNAEETKMGKKKHNSTTYVNDCNYSTPDIVKIRQIKTNIL